ncbi:hypothetical protein B0H14DRAFT_3489694 [Mycena olivaceomarginata]|nr:hypothetical protein B0H14DRAFT_3489694 [Mycena olivaceomarginata]
MPIKSEDSSASPLSDCAPRPSGFASVDTNYNYLMGAHLTHHKNTLGNLNPEEDTSFASSGSSDTAFDDEHVPTPAELELELCGDLPTPKAMRILHTMHTGRVFHSFLHVPQRMTPWKTCPVQTPRPVTLDFFTLHQNQLKANVEDNKVQLSPTEVQVLAAIRADRDAEIREYALRELEWYCDMSKMHNQATRIATLESLLEYHCIALPA